MTPSGIKKRKRNDAPFSIMAVAELVEVSSQTLILYEKSGLVFPAFEGKTRLYSAHDVKWLRCFRELIHGKKISIEALKKLLKYAPCWEIKDCPDDEYEDCMKSSDKRFTGAAGAPTSRDR
jgi:MerR family transcriptional regulator, heat shock protein HspR